MRGEKACEGGGKRAFTSRRAAMAACKTVSNKIRPYFCPVCHLWHITSQIRPDDES